MLDIYPVESAGFIYLRLVWYSRAMSFPLGRKEEYQTGFSLLELLIVITILVVLSAILVFVLNPVETLKKSRDAQRVSDLATLKEALGFYLTSTSTPYLGAAASNAACRSGGYLSEDRIFYSYPSDSPGATITDTTLDAGSANAPAPSQVTQTNLRKIDSNGWIPVNLSGLPGGSPIVKFPIDPVNTISSLSIVSNDLVYRYACDSDDLTFEVNANLESSAYTSGSGTENLEKSDGGNNDNYYEVGTKLTILGSGTDF